MVYRNLGNVSRPYQLLDSCVLKLQGLADHLHLAPNTAGHIESILSRPQQLTASHVESTMPRGDQPSSSQHRADTATPLPPYIPPEQNLAYRAALALRQLAVSRSIPGAQQRGVTITLEKNIPIAAGLGGGSSDAAAVLIGLNTLWKFNFSEYDLAAIGAELGCDIPLFIAPQPSLLVSNFGEVVTPCCFDMAVDILLVNPGKPLNTALVYAKYREISAATAPASNPATADNAASHPAAPAPFQEMLAWPNDLQMPAIMLYSEIAEILAYLQRQPGVIAAKLSGSGPTCIAFFVPGEGRRMAAQIAIRSQFPGCWTHFETVLLPR